MLYSVILSLLYIIKCIHRIKINNNDSIIHTIKKKYGRQTLKLYRELEKSNIKYVRTEKSCEFLRKCLLYQIIPRFIRFKPYDKNFIKTTSYNEIGRKMTFDLYKRKQLSLNKIQKDINIKEISLKNQLSLYTWIKTHQYLNDRIKKECEVISSRHNEKLIKMNIPNDKNTSNKKLVYNFSHRKLTDMEEKLLANGWKFALKSKKVNHLNVKSELEYIYFMLNKNRMLTSNDKISKIKSLLSYFPRKLKKQLKDDIPNLSTEENKAISNLLNDKSIIISKADKGNAIVILNKEDYIKKGNELLNDKNVFKKISSNLTEQREQSLIKFLLKLKSNKVINDKDYQQMRPKTCSRTPEAYFLTKVHKQNQPVRPIISSYNSYNYNTAKFLAKLLAPSMTCNMSYIKDSFDLVNKIKQHRTTPGLMCSLDVSSLFTNIPLDKATDIAIENIRKYNKNLKLNKTQLKELFKYCTKLSNFTFNNENYDQINGVAMGSPLAPIIAHLFMSNLEENISKYKGKKPEIYYRYVDDIFMIINGTQKDIAKFKKFMNSLEKTIKFTVEVQTNNKLNFLDVTIERENDYLITYVYHKPTDTGLYLKWVSNQPKKYKINLIKCLCNRAMKICSSDNLLKKELEYYKKTFINNGYPLNVVKKAIRKFELKKNINNNTQSHNSNAQSIYISMPFYNESSIKLAKMMKRILDLPNKRITFGFKSQTRICSLFSSTYRNKKETSNQVIYQYDCQDCKNSYIGQTSRNVEQRKREHQNALNGIGISKIADHCLQNNHNNDWNYKILATESNDTKRLIKESLLMDIVKEKTDRIIYSQKSFDLNIFG